MSKRVSDTDFKSVLSSIENKLKSIQNTLSSFENRIEALEQAVSQKVSFSGENPLIYSKVLMGTVDAIGAYERKNGQGIVAKDLARIRGVELPTIYDHLSKLEESKLVFWQRGTELGLKPANAKFYSLLERDARLEDIPVLMALPDKIVPIAQAILNSGKAGVSKASLIEIINSLIQSKDKTWRSVAPNKIETELDNALKVLLRRVLIRSEKTIDQDYYYPLSE